MKIYLNGELVSGSTLWCFLYNAGDAASNERLAPRLMTDWHEDKDRDTPSYLIVLAFDLRALFGTTISGRVTVAESLGLLTDGREGQPVYAIMPETQFEAEWLNEELKQEYYDQIGASYYRDIVVPYVD